MKFAKQYFRFEWRVGPLWTIAAYILILWCPVRGSAADTERMTVRDVSNRKQLFIDDRFIASRTNVQLTVNTPKLAGVALSSGPAGSWDDGELSCGQVVEDQGIFKMWVSGFSAKSLKGDWRKLDVSAALGYATSKDGVHWIKPNLGVFEYGGNRQNNIVCEDAGYVMIDPKSEPAARYKMLCTAGVAIGAKTVYEALEPKTAGLYFYTSPDGIHWNWNSQRVFPFYPDTQNQIDYDARIGKYVAYIRAWPGGFLFKKTYGRTVGRIEMDDPLSPWPYATNVIPVKPWGPKYIATAGKETPITFTFPDYDKAGVWTDVYNPCVSIYPWAEDVYLAFPSMNHYLANSTNENDSRLNIGMVTSRDGNQWQWPSIEPYIPAGPPGSGHSAQLYNLVGMLKVADHIFQYFCATDLGHNENWGKDYTLEQLHNVGQIYRTVQRLDGFVSADFSAGGGELITPPLRFSGSRLLLNLDATGGAGQVELLDAFGAPIPGFELAECQRLKSDSVNQTVSWKQGSDVSALKDQPIRIRFKMRAAKLFAFQFAG